MVIGEALLTVRAPPEVPDVPAGPVLPPAKSIIIKPEPSAIVLIVSVPAKRATLILNLSPALIFKIREAVPVFSPELVLLLYI